MRINTLYWYMSALFLGLFVENILASYAPPGGEQYRMKLHIVWGIAFALSLTLAIIATKHQTESDRHRIPLVIVAFFIALIIMFVIILIG